VALADTKKCQTLINLCGYAAQQLEAMATQLETYRAVYQSQGIDPTGTALEGHMAQVSAWIDGIRACADDPVTMGLINAIVPSHRNKALEV